MYLIKTGGDALDSTALQCTTPRRSSLDVLGKLSDDISRGIVLAYVEVRGSVARKDPVAGLDGATNLSGRLPDYLREMRILWVVRVVLGSFISPEFDGVSNRKTTGTGCKVLAVWPERPAGVLEDTLICPSLC